MADENEVQAEAPANDGFIDHDAVDAEVAKPEGEEPASTDAVEKTEGEDEKDGDKPAENEGDEDKPKKRSGIQRLKARNEQLASELSARERQLEELQRKVTAPSDEKEPVESDYPDYFAWQRALSAHDTRKVIREEQSRSAQNNIQVERQNLQRERIAAHQERVEAAKEFITDYDAVVNSANGIQLSPQVAEEILSSEKSGLIAYHLAKNPEKISAMNGMTGRELAKEIGRLEGSVRAPSAKTQTSAPPPPSKVSGGSSPQSQEAVLSNWLAKTYGKR